LTVSRGTGRLRGIGHVAPVCTPPNACLGLHNHFHTTVLRPFFRDHRGEPVPEENFWTLWCKGRLTETDTSTVRLGATPSGLTNVHLHHPPTFLQARCRSCYPTNSVEALKASSLAESKSQMTASSVQPFLHSSRQRMAILYNGPPLSPLKIAPFRGQI